MGYYSSNSTRKSRNLFPVNPKAPTPNFIEIPRNSIRISHPKPIDPKISRIFFQIKPVEIYITTNKVVNWFFLRTNSSFCMHIHTQKTHSSHISAEIRHAKEPRFWFKPVTPSHSKTNHHTVRAPKFFQKPPNRLTVPKFRKLVHSTKTKKTRTGFARIRELSQPTRTERSARLSRPNWKANTWEFSSHHVLRFFNPARCAPRSSAGHMTD